MDALTTLKSPCAHNTELCPPCLADSRQGTCPAAPSGNQGGHPEQPGAGVSSHAVCSKHICAHMRSLRFLSVLSVLRRWPLHGACHQAHAVSNGWPHKSRHKKENNVLCLRDRPDPLWRHSSAAASGNPGGPSGQPTAGLTSQAACTQPQHPKPSSLGANFTAAQQPARF